MERFFTRKMLFFLIILLPLLLILTENTQIIINYKNYNNNKYGKYYYGYSFQGNEDKLVVLKSVPFLHSKNITGYGNFTSGQKDARMLEIMDAIQKTLNHEIIGKLHIFYQDLQLIYFMEKQNLNNVHKIRFIPNMEDTMTSLFHYANEYLCAQVVMVMNADVYPGEGFEQLDFEYLRRNKVMYGLSR